MDADQAFEYLERALASDEHAQFPYWVGTDKDLRPLRNDPRWPALLDEIGHHRLAKNGYDPGALKMLRTAAYKFDTNQPGTYRGLIIAMEILKARTRHQGEQHLDTISARNDAAMFSWTAKSRRRVDELIGPIGTLTPLAVQERDQVKSARREKLRAGIIFVNETDRDLDYYWINWDGIPSHRGKVAAGGSKAVSSGPRQAWKLGDTVFVTTERPALATVSE